MSAAVSVYLSRGMHRGGSGSLRDFDWSERRWNSSQASMACRDQRSARLAEMTGVSLF
jgi:hypothetical protein